MPGTHGLNYVCIYWLVLLMFVTFGAAVEKNVTFNIVTGKRSVNSKCMNETFEIVENYDTNIRMHSKAIYDDAWCTNDDTGAIFSFQISVESKTISTVLHGVYGNQGKWQCTFVSRIPIKTNFTDQFSFEVTYCTFNVRIKKLPDRIVGNERIREYESKENLSDRIVGNSDNNRTREYGDNENLSDRIFGNSDNNRTREYGDNENLSDRIFGNSDNNRTREYGDNENLSDRIFGNSDNNRTREYGDNENRLHLVIRKIGGSYDNTFKYGDVLEFLCFSDSIFINNRNITMILQPAGETKIFKIRHIVRKFARNGYSYVGNYQMNFTSDVLVTCHAVDYFSGNTFSLVQYKLTKTEDADLSDRIIGNSDNNRTREYGDNESSPIEEKVTEASYPAEREINKPYSDFDGIRNVWVFIIIAAVVLIVIIGTVVYCKAKRLKPEDNEPLYSSVIYDTRDPLPSTPPIETAPALRQTRVSRDSAKYVTMTPGETPSVTHYLYPSQLTTLKLMKKSLQQDLRVSSESERYINMKSDNSSAALNATEYENPNDHVSSKDRYLTMKPGNPSAIMNAPEYETPHNHDTSEINGYLCMTPGEPSAVPYVPAYENLTSSWPESSKNLPIALTSFDTAVPEVIYEDCNENSWNKLSQE